MRSLVFLLLLVLVGCTSYKSQPIVEPIRPRWDTFDSTAIDRIKLLTSASIKKFYRENNFQLVWVDTAGLTASADSMINIIRSARYYGLNPEDYHYRKLNDLIPLAHSKANAVIIDLCLTDSFLALYHHLKEGRIEKKSLNFFDLSSILPDSDELSALRNALQDGSVKTSLALREPDYLQYHILKAELKSLLDNNGCDDLCRRHIDQLMVNMERWRWRKKDYPERYIAVNTPSFMLKVVEGDSVFLESRVIVGKRDTPTPELESIIRSFIIYPYWHVPKSIVKEILPAIQNDSLYMKKHNYEVLDRNGKVMDASSLDWASFTPENFPYVLRQREGSENTMGVIKFVFNNNYGVYLHDTNARGLFRREKRDLSHGCIRVQKAVELAHYLARDDDTYVGPEDLDQYLLVQHKMTVDVVKPAPVILEYLTASVENGKVVFYNDTYGKDQDIINSWYHYSLHAADQATSTLLQ